MVRYTFLFLILFAFFCKQANAQIPTRCFEIESIFVDACGSPEQDNEMMRFRIGPADMNVSALVITWYSNSFLGICQNATSALKTAAFNRTILGCGYLKEPIGGVLPAGKEILLITSTAVDTLANSFATLNDTLIVIYQCPGATSGHFRNYSSTPLSRRTILTFTGAGGCADTAIYDAHELVNSIGGHGGGSSLENGATVDFSWSGIPSYINNGCRAPFVPLSATINQNDTTICLGTNVGLSATLEGTTSIVWSASAGSGSFNRTDSASVRFTPSSSATYPISIYMIGYTPCDSSSDTIVINAFTDPTFVGNDTSHCLRDTLALRASGAVGYLWTASSGYLSCSSCATPLVYASTSASYYVTLTYASSCTRLDTINVSVLPQDSIDIAQTDTSVCNGSILNLQGYSNAGYIWSGSPSLTCTSCSSPSIPITSSLYIVLSSNGTCQSKDSIHVTKVDYDVYSISRDTTICFGQTAYIGSIPFIPINWSNSASIAMGCSLCSSTTITPTDTVQVYSISSGYCPLKDTMTVAVVRYPTIIAAGDTTVCNGQRVTLSATGASPISWTSPSGTAGLSCTLCSNPVATATSSIIYIAQNTGLCVSADTVSVEVRNYPILAHTADTSICTGDSIHLFVTGDSAYVWNSPSGTSTLSCTTCQFPTANPMANIVYTLSSVGFCVTTDSIHVSVASSANIIATNDTTICNGQSLGLSVSGASTYSWTSPSGTSSLSCTACTSPIATPISSIIYYVQSTGISCSSSDTVNVTVSPTTKLNAGSDTTICAGELISLHATGASTFNWLSSSSPSYLSCTACPSPTANPMASISYYATTTDFCVNADTVRIDVLPVRKIFIGNDTSVCMNDTIILSATNGLHYSWSTIPASVFSCYGCGSIQPVITANITFVVDDTSKCVVGDTVTISVLPNPIVNAGVDAEIISGGSTILLGTGATTYIWSPNTAISDIHVASPEVNPTATTTYIVEGIDANGCINFDSVLVVVKPSTCAVAIPSGFSPNNDGKNDVFKVLSGCSISNFNMLIVNRWGEIVFESADQSVGWDGMYKEREQPINTYVFYVTGLFDNAEKLNLTGTITLIR
jgi:gliding motility-associated-like protein